MLRIAVAALLMLAGMAGASPLKFKNGDFVARDSIITGSRDKQIKVTVADADPKAGLVWRFDKKLDGRACDKRQREMWFTGPPGTYEIEVLSIKLNPMGETEVESAKLTLQILAGTDDPVKPKPDDPVKPKPDDPATPADPLVKAIADAYRQDAEPDKAALKAAFARTFRAAREDKVLDGAKTTAGLFDAMGVLLAADKVKGQIIHTQEAVNAYLKEQVPGIEQSLTPSRKAKIKNEFQKIADSLDAVK